MKKDVVFIVWGLIAALSFAVFEHPSRAAEAESPATSTTQDHEVAAKHLKAMRAELISLSKTQPVLQGIEQDHLRIPASGNPTNVCSSFDCPKATLTNNFECGLGFLKNSVMKDYPQMSLLVPKSNGVGIDAIISSSEDSVVAMGGADECWNFKKGGSKLTIFYRLMIGDDLKTLEAPIRTILHRNLQAMQDELQQKCGWVAKGHWAHK